MSQETSETILLAIVIIAVILLTPAMTERQRWEYQQDQQAEYGSTQPQDDGSIIGLIFGIILLNVLILLVIISITKAMDLINRLRRH